MGQCSRRAAHGVAAVSYTHLKQNWLFILCVGVGAGAGILAFSKAIKFLLLHYPMATNFTFIGLILGSIPMIFKRAKEGSKQKNGTFAPFSLVSFVAMFALMVGLSSVNEGSLSNTVQTTMRVGTFIWLMACAAISTFAMILPGISCSFVMLLLGAYMTVITAVSDLNFIIQMCIRDRPHVQRQAEQIAGRYAQHQRREQPVDEREGGRAAALEQAAEGKDERHEQIIQRKGAHVGHTGGNHGGIAVEQGQNLRGEELGQGEDANADGKGNRHPDAAGTRRAVPLAGADVLRAHGGDGVIDGDGGHDGKAVELADHAHRSRGVYAADGVDQRRDEQKRKAGHAAFDARRQAEAKDKPAFIHMQAEGGELEIKDKIVAGQIHHAPHHAQRLGKDRCV